MVSDADWAAFLADTVTPRFLDGLTVLAGAGQRQGDDVVRERSKVVVTYAPGESDDALSGVNEISAAAMPKQSVPRAPRRSRSAVKRAAKQSSRTGRRNGSTTISTSNQWRTS